jgi:hypothetical protein
VRANARRARAKRAHHFLDCGGKALARHRFGHLHTRRTIQRTPARPKRCRHFVLPAHSKMRRFATPPNALRRPPLLDCGGKALARHRFGHFHTRRTTHRTPARPKRCRHFRSASALHNAALCSATKRSAAHHFWTAVAKRQRDAALAISIRAGQSTARRRGQSAVVTSFCQRTP